jgi:hypothetical protein
MLFNLRYGQRVNTDRRTQEVLIQDGKIEVTAKDYLRTTAVRRYLDRRFWQLLDHLSGVLCRRIPRSAYRIEPVHVGHNRAREDL